MRHFMFLCLIIGNHSILAVDMLSVINMSRLPLTVHYTYGDTPHCLVLPGRDDYGASQIQIATTIGCLHTIGRIQFRLGDNRSYSIDAKRWPRSQIPRDEHLTLQVAGTDVPVFRWSLPPL